MPIVGSTFVAGSGSHGVNSCPAACRRSNWRLTSAFPERSSGACWTTDSSVLPGQKIEANSPFLVGRRVRFAELPRQIAYARQLLEEDAVPDAIFT